MDHSSHNQRFSRQDVDDSNEYAQGWEDTDTFGTIMEAVTQQSHLQPSTDVRFAGHNYDSPAWEQPQYPAYHQNWPSMYPSHGRSRVLIGVPGSEAGYASSFQTSKTNWLIQMQVPRSGDLSASSSQTPPSWRRSRGRPSDFKSTSNKPKKERKKEFLSPGMDNIINTGRKVMGATLEAFRASKAANFCADGPALSHWATLTPTTDPGVWSTPTRRGKTFKEIRGHKGLPVMTARELYMGQWSCQLTLTFASSGKTITGTGMTPKSGESLDFRQVGLLDDTSIDQSEPFSKKTKRNADLLYQRIKAEHSPLQQARVSYVCFEEHSDRYDVQVPCTVLTQYGVLPASISVFLDVELLNSSECLDQDNEP
ncbi:hypothetical protein I203_102861 [Kwoniella mangroviensis CBS 8507]|uniref:uncharacterized protein n=1 Tax=Kwoniella mangroviensis CBS 8507 TaxID=1296122 RepID=UPI00080D4ACB|nr:uncharacterized protein I203_03835 [Kwoniella mangroviensis CBS 8507]OCF67149.1 hypothetical protein I203_03835 [Kwoniella mangroviensis CBS 8507]